MGKPENKDPLQLKPVRTVEEYIDQLNKEISMLKNANLQRHKHVHTNENPDSFEVGTPAKGGTIKIYHNAHDVKGFMEKLDKMLEIRRYANAQIEVAFPKKP